MSGTEQKLVACSEDSIHPCNPDQKDHCFHLALMASESERMNGVRHTSSLEIRPSIFICCHCYISATRCIDGSFLYCGHGMDANQQTQSSEPGDIYSSGSKLLEELSRLSHGNAKHCNYCDTISKILDIHGIKARNLLAELNSMRSDPITQHLRESPFGKDEPSIMEESEIFNRRKRRKK